MRSLRRVSYTLIGLLLFVFVPGFVFISLHVEKSMPINDIMATGVSGKAHIQYAVAYRVDPGAPQSPTYRNVSEWIPITPGMKIGSGAFVRTERDARVDLMTPGRIGMRLEGHGHMQISARTGKPKSYDLDLQFGKLLCRVEPPSEGKPSRPDRLRVVTPTAVAEVKGTAFAVDYLPAERATQLEVLEGLVRLAAKGRDTPGLQVGEARKVRLGPGTAVPSVDYIDAAVRRELAAALELKTAPDLKDRWDNAVAYISASPLYRKILAEIARYEMKVFVRAIRYFAPLRWGNGMPARLQDVPLEEGDYRDPWDSDYIYERMGDKQAVLISAGPDRRRHTNDDIVMRIRSLSETP